MKQTVGINSFVRRQTPASKFSHFGEHVEDIDLVANIAKERLGSAMAGYRDGVILVPLTGPTAEGFYCGVVKVAPDTPLRATFSARQPGEMPYVQVEAVSARKMPAMHVDIVLYRRDVLLEDRLLENNKRARNGEEPKPKSDYVSTDCDWEVISINARPTVEEEPMHPVAMARNFLGHTGGTPATYTAEQFAKAIDYWSTRVMAGE